MQSRRRGDVDAAVRQGKDLLRLFVHSVVSRDFLGLQIHFMHTPGTALHDVIPVEDIQAPAITCRTTRMSNAGRDSFPPETAAANGHCGVFKAQWRKRCTVCAHAAPLIVESGKRRLRFGTFPVRQTPIGMRNPWRNDEERACGERQNLVANPQIRFPFQHVAHLDEPHCDQTQFGPPAHVDQGSSFA